MTNILKFLKKKLFLLSWSLKLRSMAPTLSHCGSVNKWLITYSDLEISFAFTDQPQPFLLPLPEIVCSFHLFEK